MPLIVFEGLDGSGKSTLIRGLETHLKSQGHTVVVTREPGGTPLGEELRELLTSTKKQTPTPRAEALLYQAIRAQHVDLVIEPSLKAGAWVLCDRFRASSVAFQGGARGIDQAAIEWLNEFSTKGLHPGLTVLLDLTVEESSKRLAKRYESGEEGLDRFESEEAEFHERVRASYLAQAKKAENKNSWLILDSSKSPDSLLKELVDTLSSEKFGEF